MTDEEINVTIAEACGILSKDQWGKIYKTPQGYVRDVPDYLNDLNACAEFEAVLTSAERFTYIVELNKLCGDEPSAVWATARQRAEAFLKTLNLWKP